MRAIGRTGAWLLIALGFVVVSSGCGLLGNAFGTGATPYTREIEVMVVANVSGTANQVPVANATVTLSQASSNQSTSGGTSSTSQTMGTDPNGRVLFRVEPGESYTITVSASGYASATIMVSPSYYSPDTIQRTITLARSA